MTKRSQQSNREQWMSHVNEWRRSGLTQSGYCRAQGLTLGTFHAWVARVKKGSVEAAVPPTLVPVVVTPAVAHAPVSSPLSLQHANGWQRHLPAGTQADWLGKVLKELA